MPTGGTSDAPAGPAGPTGHVVPTGRRKVDTQVVDELYPRLDYFVAKEVVPSWLEVQGSLGPSIRADRESGGNASRRAQEQMTRIDDKLYAYTEAVAHWLGAGNEPPPEAAKDLELELSGLREQAAVVTRHDRQAQARALRAIDNLARTLQWENVEAKVGT